MAQGKRKLMLAIGAGLMVCTGLAGCTNNERKPLLPTARGPGLSPSANQNSQLPRTANARTPSSGALGNTGLSSTTGFQESGGYQPGRVSPATGMPPGGMGNPGNTGIIQSQRVPGAIGEGDPLPTSSPIMPSVTPQSSNFSNPTWQQTTGSVPGQTVSGRTATPSLRATDPPPPELSELPLPPAPPYGSGMPSSLAPPTPSVTSPIPPPDQPQFMR